jgi:hypothetical protein
MDNMFTIATTFTIIRSLQDSVSNSLDATQFWRDLKLSDPRAFEDRGGEEERRNAESILLAQQAAMEDFQAMLSCVVAVSTERHKYWGGEEERGCPRRW